MTAISGMFATQAPEPGWFGLDQSLHLGAWIELDPENETVG
jgi:hypothetical protein